MGYADEPTDPRIRLPDPPKVDLIEVQPLSTLVYSAHLSMDYARDADSGIVVIHAAYPVVREVAEKCLSDLANVLFPGLIIAFDVPSE